MNSSLPLNQLVFVSFDTETTGLSPGKSRIVELSGVKFKSSGAVLSTFTRLINPEMEIPPEATALHGITSDMLFGQPRDLDVIPEFLEWATEDAVLVAHNASFDVSFLQEVFLRLNNNIPALLVSSMPVLDTLSLARELIPKSPNHQLGTLVKFMSLPPGTYHRALADSYHVKNLLCKLLSLFPQIATLAQLDRHTIWLANQPKPLSPYQSENISLVIATTLACLSWLSPAWSFESLENRASDKLTTTGSTTHSGGTRTTRGKSTIQTSPGLQTSKDASSQQPNRLSPQTAASIERHQHLGNQFFKSKDFTNALLEYQMVLRLDPDNFEGHFNLGKTLLAVCDYEEALAEAFALIALQPASPASHLFAGEVWQHKGNISAAYREYKEALSLDSKNATTHAHLADYYCLKGWSSFAITECQHAILLNPALPEPHLVLARVYANKNQPDLAINESKIAVDLAPDDSSIRTEYATILNQLGKYEEAQVEFQKAATQDPRNAAAHLGLSRVLASTNQLPQAISEALKAVALAPTNSDMHVNLAKLYEKQGDCRAAIVQYQLALKLEPNNPRLHQALGMDWKDSGQLNNAIAELLIAKQLLPKDNDIRQALHTLTRKKEKQE